MSDREQARGGLSEEACKTLRSLMAAHDREVPYLGDKTIVQLCIEHAPHDELESILTAYLHGGQSEPATSTQSTP